MLWLAAAVGFTVFVVAVCGGPGDPRGEGYERLYTALFLIPAGLCLLRGLLIREQRLAWLAFGVGMVCWAAGYGNYFGFLQGLEAPPYPSPSDALWLSYYAMSFVGLLALLNVRSMPLRRRIWVDAAGGGLAIAAIGAALFVEPLFENNAGDVPAMATNMAYPLLHVLILSLLLGVFAISHRRPGRVWNLMGAVWVIQTVADLIHLAQVADGTYQTGGPLDASWPALMLVVAYAAWQQPTVAKDARVQDRGALPVSVAFVVVGLFVLTYDRWRELDDVAVVLATMTLLVAFVRTTMTFADMRALAHGKELLLQNKLILDSAGEAIVGIDAAGAVTFANPAAARMTQYTAEEMKGRNLHALVHHSKADGSPYPAAECPMLAAVAEGRNRNADELLWRKDGTSFPVEYTSTPIVDGMHTGGGVLVFRDVTDRRELERVKDQFTSVVSHELRTPLTAIRGSLGLLESGVLGPLPDKGQRMIHIAVQNTDRLVRLINDILDLERIDSGAMRLCPTRCDAAELIASATDTVLAVAHDAGVTLVVDAGPVPFVADADRIIQTLTNLIGNAVKFSPAGGTVNITSERCGREILFTVTDHGRGIPVDKLETIFERFEQVDVSDARQKGGTGLGLAICRSIVECHGGRIWAHSAPGQGSTFSFVVPGEPEDAAPQASPADTGRGPVVLVCDDDASVVEVVGAILEEGGYRVIPARSGQTAIRRAIAERPDAILLDLLMPGMSGRKTIELLAEHPETVDIPIVILSALPRGDREMPGGAAFDWIEKPAADADLFAALERAIGSRDDIFRVVFVEDDPALALVLQRIFERYGVKGFAASGAREALELCQRIAPDLLVVGIDVPDVEGRTAADWIARHEPLRALPIVGYTTDGLQDAQRDQPTLGTLRTLLTKDQLTSEEFERCVTTLLAPPPTTPDIGDAS